MKKLIAILFAIVMIACLTGCMEIHEKTTITSWTLGGFFYGGDSYE